MSPVASRARSANLEMALRDAAAAYESLTGRPAITEIRPARGRDTGHRREFVTDLGVMWGPREAFRSLRDYVLEAEEFCQA